MSPLFLISCKHKVLPNQYMIDLLKDARGKDSNANNVFSAGAMVKFCDSVIHNSSDENAITNALTKKANALLQLGEEQKAIDLI